MNFIKQLIFYTYCSISSNEKAMGIQAIHCDNNDIAWWNFTRYQDEFISKSKIQVATVYKNMKLYHNINKEIICIAQKNHNNNQYELKIILKTPSIYAIFNGPSWWNVTYRFIVL